MEMPLAWIRGRRHFHVPLFPIPNIRFKHVFAIHNRISIILKGYGLHNRIMDETLIKKEIENHENQDYNSNSGNRNHIDGCRQQPCLWRGLDVSKGLWGLYQL